MSTHSEGIDFVLSDGSSSYTFIYSGSSIKLKNQATVGDLHEKEYERYKKSYGSFSSKEYSSYSIIFYPTDSYFTSPNSIFPLLGGIIVAVVFFCLAVFFVTYSFYVNKQLHNTEEALASKRKFVRFISHEIRTPLNTVCVGLRVLTDEVKKCLKSAVSESKTDSTVSTVTEFDANHENKLPHFVRELIFGWMELIQDLVDSSSNAVSVLNELMSYDKIEMKTYHIEKDILPLWTLLSDSIRPFNIQAREKQITMSIDREIDHLNIETAKKELLEKLSLCGDSIKLEQVFRNVVSNALKFSCSNSTVHISTKWEPDKLIDEGNLLKYIISTYYYVNFFKVQA
jgi:signal transduction histidine kinase